MSLSSTMNRLVMTRRVAATRESVFRAWTDPEQLQRWFFVRDPETTSHAEIDLRVGGRYQMRLCAPHGEVTYAVGGMYHEIDPPAKLVFSWRWEVPPVDTEDTLVTVELHDVDDALTEVVVIHERSPDQTACWAGRLDRLTHLLG
jgi:uncharacterized protein YndB with AHSA1/START domain